MTIHVNRSATLPDPNESFDPSNVNDSDFYLNGTLYQNARPIEVTEQAGVSLSNYLVPLTFYSGDLSFANTQSDGSDVRFSDPDGNEWRYWVEKWDVTNEVGVVWVEVPDIPANGGVQFFMFYGNSSVAAQSTTAIWNIYDDFTDSSPLSEWTVHDGSFSVDASDRAYGTTDEAQNTMTHDGGSFTDFAVEMLGERTASGGAGTTEQNNTVGRYDRTNGDFYFLRSRPDQNNLEYYYQDGTGSNTKFAAPNYSHGFGTYRSRGGWYGTSLRYNLYDTNYSLLKATTASDNSETGSGYVGIRPYEDEERYHWIAVRDFVEPEPSVSIGSEGAV